MRAHIHGGWFLLCGCAPVDALPAAPAPGVVSVEPLPATPEPSVEKSCRGATLPLDTAEPEGPFASLAAMCAHALARQGNDAQRVCHEDIGAVTLALPRFEVTDAIHDARVVAYDGGGDFIHCNLAVLTKVGWTVFLGPVCENSMNEQGYDFTVHDLALRRHGGGTLLVYRFTVTEHIVELADGHVQKGAFLSLCGVPPGTDAPVCSTVPEAMSARGELIDYATELRDGAVVIGGPIRGDDVPWVVFDNYFDNRQLLEVLHPPNRFCVPTFR